VRIDFKARKVVCLSFQGVASYSVDATTPYFNRNMMATFLSTVEEVLANFPFCPNSLIRPEPGSIMSTCPCNHAFMFFRSLESLDPLILTFNRYHTVIQAAIAPVGLSGRSFAVPLMIPYSCR
jgi:hypothetical protein